MKLKQALVAGTLLLTPYSEAKGEDIIVDARDYPSINEIRENGCAARIAATLTLERVGSAVKSKKHEFARIALKDGVKYVGRVTEANRVNFDNNRINPDLEVSVLFQIDDESWNGRVTGDLPLGAKDFSFTVNQNEEGEEIALHLQSDTEEGIDLSRSVNSSGEKTFTWTGVDPAYRSQMCERNGSTYSLGRLDVAFTSSKNALEDLNRKTD